MSAGTDLIAAHLWTDDWLYCCCGFRVKAYNDLDRDQVWGEHLASVLSAAYTITPKETP